MLFVFRSASVCGAANKLGDRFIYIVYHMWLEKLLSERIVYFTLTWVLGDEEVMRSEEGSTI